jgi:hypothetical protein
MAEVAASKRRPLIIDLRARLFTIPRILKRVAQVGWRGFPMSHITSWMIQYPQGRAFTQYAAEHAARRAGELGQPGGVPPVRTR